ncbi:MAG: non-ribosomal peptide synthetase [Ktedonobacteraceae bacterium]|nr:non-ribosomal peptide synthetase [Ktedonobacteraceae bacterium]
MLKFTQRVSIEQAAVNENEQDILVEWNNTRSTYSAQQRVYQLFEAQVERTPDALAIASQEGRLTYQELNQKANQVARYLQRRGVKSEMLVGICFNRSLDMIVSMLGILKAGGAYVPFDPGYPVERLSFMLKDSQAPLVVTQGNFSKHFSQSPSSSVICMDTDWGIISKEERDNVENKAASNDLAYVIYTSGSTGQPKGVQITHESLLNLVFWHQRAFEVTAIDRATQLASPAFDATGWEIWPYLTHGASIHIADEDVRVSPLFLRDWLLSNQITISFMPTMLAERMIALDWPTETPLRILLTGADKLRHYPSATLPFALINNYGPTEATVVATSGRILPDLHPSSAPSIGRPISNTQIFLLDEQLRQVPIGTTGELYIGGAGLAKGYLNRPELTAEKFIAHPFSQDPDARLYKTGDLAQYLPDGQLLFLGRSDDQIKLRGFRIEPDEITAVLNKNASVQTSLVIAREETSGEKRLVAYLVLADDAHGVLESLRASLREHLPEYMIPSAFVVLDTLPITAHGKVDHKALPAPDETNTLQEQSMALPATPTEVEVANIIKPLLDLKQVSVDENFFLLGGHSLLGTQLITRIAETFDVKLSLRVLFGAPTIRDLSLEIEGALIARLEAMSDEEAERYLA